MSNVITLAPPLPGSPLDGDIVAQLELLLDLAKQGSVTSFAYIAVGDPTQAPATGHSGPHRNAMIAGLLTLIRMLEWVRC